MHLLQAGVNLIYIRDILGHVSVQTTEIYARVDSKAKQDALEMAYAEVGIKEPEIKTWEKDGRSDSPRQRHRIRPCRRRGDGEFKPRPPHHSSA